MSIAAYLLLPAAGSVLMVSRSDQLVRRLGEIVLLGPLAVYLLLLLASVLRLPLHPWLLAAVVLVLALLSLYRRRGSAGTDGGQREVEDGRGRFLLLVLGVGIATAVLSLAAPIFISDPVNIYAPPAVVYAEAGAVHPRLLARIVEPYHPDYPPLYTLNLTWQYLWAGGYDGWAGKPLGALFLAGLLLELWNLATALGLRGGRAAFALIFGLLPITLKQATAGFADLAVTAYLAGGLAALIQLERDPTAGRREALRAGLFLAAAAATKNEGAALAVLLTGTCWLCAPARRRLLGWVAAGGLVLAAPWYLWLRAHGVENDLVAAAGSVGVREAGARLGTVLSWFGQEAVATLRTASLAEGAVRVPQFGLLFALFAAALPVRVVQLLRARRVTQDLLVAPLQLALFAAVFACTPHDLAWHLDTASSRVLLQCLPALAALAGGAVVRARD